jgi:hypothetical protein
MHTRHCQVKMINGGGLMAHSGISSRQQNHGGSTAFPGSTDRKSDSTERAMKLLIRKIIIEASGWAVQDSSSRINCSTHDELATNWAIGKPSTASRAKSRQPQRSDQKKSKEAKQTWRPFFSDQKGRWARRGEGIRLRLNVLNPQG